MPDFSVLEDKVVRVFADGPSGSDWMRLRQAGPSVPDAAGDMITPAPDEAFFRAFLNEGGKATIKGQPGGEVKDGSLTLFTCKTQTSNGLLEEVDFTATDEEAQVRGDDLRRESTGEIFECVAATFWEAGGFWVLSARLVVGG
jgi:hypothetical protein